MKTLSQLKFMQIIAQEGAVASKMDGQTLMCQIGRGTMMSIGLRNATMVCDRFVAQVLTNKYLVITLNGLDYYDVEIRTYAGTVKACASNVGVEELSKILLDLADEAC